MNDLAIYLVAALFAVMGLGALISPDRVTEQFGIPPLSVAGRNEVRGVYGGFGLAIALVLIWATRSPELRPGVALAVAAALLGMAAGRAISAVADRSLPGRPLLYLVIEVVAAGLLAYGAEAA